VLDSEIVDQKIKQNYNRMKKLVSLVRVSLSINRKDEMVSSIWYTWKIAQDDKYIWTAKEKGIEQETGKIILNCKWKCDLKRKKSTVISESEQVKQKAWENV